MFISAWKENLSFESLEKVHLLDQNCIAIL